MISIFGQFSGNGLGYFNTVIFGILGVTSSSTQLGYNLLNSVLSAVGALTAVSLTDRMPRRKVLVFGTLGKASSGRRRWGRADVEPACAVALATNAGLSAAIDQQGQNVVPSYAQGGLASYFLFNIIFSFTYTPLQAVVATEALESTTRAKGLAASAMIVNAIGFINQFAGPIALGNIKYRYIYVFVGWDCFEALMWYLFGYAACLHPATRLRIRIADSVLFPASRRRVVRSRSSNGCTISRIRSRRRSRSTRSWCKRTGPSPKRLCRTRLESVRVATDGKQNGADISPTCNKGGLGFASRSHAAAVANDEDVVEVSASATRSPPLRKRYMRRCEPPDAGDEGGVYCLESIPRAKRPTPAVEPGGERA